MLHSIIERGTHLPHNRRPIQSNLITKISRNRAEITANHRRVCVCVYASRISIVYANEFRKKKIADEIKINTLTLNIVSSQKTKPQIVTFTISQNYTYPSHFPYKWLVWKIVCIFVCFDYGNFNLNFYFQLQSKRKKKRKSHTSAKSSIFVEPKIYAVIFHLYYKIHFQSHSVSIPFSLAPNSFNK